MAPVVALHHELVGARDQRQPVAMVERLRDVLAEGVAGAAGRYAPSASGEREIRLVVTLFYVPYRIKYRKD